MQQGRFDLAIKDVERLLLLTCDLQPRGVLITQLVSAAIEQFNLFELVLPILNARGLRTAHCDQVLQVLEIHRKAATDGHVEAAKAEWVTLRDGLAQLVRAPGKLAREAGMPAGQSVAAALSGGEALKGIPDLDAKLSRASPAELVAMECKLDGYCQCQLGLGRRRGTAGRRDRLVPGRAGG